MRSRGWSYVEEGPTIAGQLVPRPRPENALHGRDSEREKISRLIASRPATLAGIVIVGEPGIGKSTLLTSAVTRAARYGARVLQTTCVEAEKEMPYAGLEGLLGGVLDELGETVPEPQRDALHTALLRAGSTAAPDPRTVAAGVFPLVRRAAGRAGITVAVDDWQWLDVESRTCLTYALRRLVDHPITVLVTTRTPSMLAGPFRSESTDARLLSSLGKEHRTRMTILRLGALDATAIGELVGDRLGFQLPWPDRDHLAAETDGNPFWALELARHRSGDTDRDASTDDVPPSLAALVDERVRGLGPDVVWTASLVAALGRPRTTQFVADLARTSGGNRGNRRPRGDERATTSSAFEADLDDGVRRGLLIESDGRIAPAHPLIGTALLARLSPFQRRRLHRRAACLADSPEAKAQQLLQATPTGAAEPSEFDQDQISSHEMLAALDAACEAARRRGAHQVAAHFAVNAITLLERQVPARGYDVTEVVGHPRGSKTPTGRLIALAELHRRAGESERTVAVLRALDLGRLDIADLERAAPLLTETVNEQRGATVARAAVDAVAALPDRHLPPSVRSRRRALVLALQADQRCGAIGDRRHVARRAVHQAERSGVGQGVRPRALGALAWSLLDRGEPITEVLERLERVREQGDVELGAGHSIEFLRGIHHWVAMDVDGARRAFGGVFEHPTPLGDVVTVILGGTMLAYIDLLVGDLPACERTLSRLETDVGRDTLDRLSIVDVHAALHLVRGEHRALEDLLDVQASRGNRTSRAMAFAARLRGALAVQRNEPERALGFLNEFDDIADRCGFPKQVHHLDGDDNLIDAALAVGDYARAAEVVSQLGDAAGSTDNLIMRGRHQRALAKLLVGRDHDLDRAVTVARHACTAHEQCQLPPEHASSLSTLADVLAARSDLEPAALHRKHAHEVFVRAGYSWRAEQTAGRTAPRPIPGRRPLTPSEQAVTQSVVAGATNREVAAALHLSVSTVENHLRAIYRKLGIRTRSELTPHVLDAARD